MKAYALDELGSPGSVRDVPVPEPSSGQVRIKVAAASLNPFDAAVVRGYMKGRMEHHFPLIPGSDVSGTVDATGDGTDLSVGDQVFGVPGSMSLGEGTLAEYAIVSTATIARKPSAFEHAAAATMPIAGVTAWKMNEAATISKGDVVIVLGATGGVGSYFVQLAARAGGHVVAVCSTANIDYARRLGAADVIDYTEGDVADAVAARFTDGIDAVADMHGDKDVMAKIAGAIKPGGRVVSAVGSADEESLSARRISATNVMGMVMRQDLEALAGVLEHGDIDFPEIRTVPLEDAADALDLVGSGHVRGKIVVTP